MKLNGLISPARCRELHQRLAQIGRVCKHSVERLAYSDQETAAHNFLADQCGWAKRTDPHGNTFFRRPGRCADLKPICMGSHPDTVIRGGHFDGSSGCIAAIQVAEALDVLGLELDHPTEVVLWRGEESTRFRKAMLGSSAYSRLLKPKQLDELVDGQGMTLRQAMSSQQLDPGDFVWDTPVTERMDRYFELHIEQGPLLTAANVPVGIVQEFCGTWRALVYVTGKSDHSSIPFVHRRDAGLAAQVMSVEIQRLLWNPKSNSYPVVTVGEYSQNGGMNIIAGKAEFSIDFRGLNSEVLAELGRKAVAIVERVAAEFNVNAEVKQLGLTDPVKTDLQMNEILRAAALENGTQTIDIVSGAGHDAVPLLLSGVPAGKIFVRSGSRVPGGAYSHSPEEFAEIGDLVVGTEVMLRALIAADNLRR